MTLTKDRAVRENHVVEFEEGRLIAWRPAEPGQPPPGHLWRWELEPLEDATTRVTHTYDWTGLTDENRLPRARRTTAARLLASPGRLGDVASRPADLPALFAGLSVADLAVAESWYERLLGKPASFHPNDVEAVWDLAPGRSVYIQLRPEHAGHGLALLFVA